MASVDGADIEGRQFAIVVIGTGFGSSFFLAEALRRVSGPVAVLEWGGLRDHATQIREQRNGSIAPSQTFVNRGTRPWNFTIAFGGGTNCWFGQTPRMHPSDFRLRSSHGVGHDWPFDYSELEPYYCEAEEMMGISGDSAIGAVTPRSQPFPQPPHRFSTADRLIAQARPQHHFVMPTARARVSTATRPQCCASLRCNLCPNDAKFTVINGMTRVYGNERVHLCTGAEVRELEIRGNSVVRARFRREGRDHWVAGDFFVLGANAIHSPGILLRSAMTEGPVGRGLHEAYGIEAEILLDGVDNFDGSTITTGIDYGSYDGNFRSHAGSALIHFENRWKFGFRTEPGRWRQTLPVTIAVETLPREEDKVTVDRKGKVEVHSAEPGAYARAGAQRALEELERIAACVPAEKVVYRGERPTESHLQGTLRMGPNKTSSVVDPLQLHHNYRNLAVVGSSVFPTCTATNPSLTVAALSLRAARGILA